MKGRTFLNHTREAVSLKDLLLTHTIEGPLFETMENDWIRCLACGHRCKLPSGKDGICRVRYNNNGKLFVPDGYVGGVGLDPIEKKPFFHAYPGERALSFGMLGCNFRCPFCQNWVTSQVLRDPDAIAHPEFLTPEQFVESAVRSKARAVTSTYNEPLITVEWAVKIFKLAKAKNLATSIVSNGNGTPEVIEYLAPWLDLAKIDLKSFRQKEYATFGGVLKNVLETIKLIYQKGIWLEIVTLVVPQMNDSDEELRDIAEFVASVSPDIPWHVTSFHSDYKMTGRGSTPASTLMKAVAIGKKAGLKFVYTGNLPGETGNLESTFCPACNTLLIERQGYRIIHQWVTNGMCYKCNLKIPGRWT
jgi:pyruvate formate lyase activating enzyme